MKYLLIVVFAFIFQFTDTALGMGYGTALTPILLLMGFPPLVVLPAIVFSQFITSLTGAFFHHRFDNVDFRHKSQDLKVATILMVAGIVGVVVAALLVVKIIPEDVLKYYIGGLVTVAGLLILANHHKQFRFSWPRVVGLGSLAGFNKGMSGGGYGPLVTAGQVLTGVKEKNAIGICALAEGVVCFVGFLVFALTKGMDAWVLVPWVLLGSMASIPIAAKSVNWISSRGLRVAIGLLTVALGVLTLVGAK